MPLLEVSNLCKCHAAGKMLFRAEASLVLLPGQALGITGPSGCGKSTVLEMLALLSEPTNAGRFLLRLHDQSHDLAALWREAPQRLAAIRRRHLGFVHQGGGLYPFLSVRENIHLPLLLNGFEKMPETNARVEELLNFLGLASVADKLPETLSYGERQRTAIARALVHRPSLVLADEPTSALDPETALAAMRLLVSGARERDSALVVVSHDHALLEKAGIPAVAMQPLAEKKSGEKCYSLVLPAPRSEAPTEKPAAVPALPRWNLPLLHWLALRDFRHERALSLCAVLAFAAALTPLMVLGGLRTGVIATLSQRLLNNPAALAVNPYSSRSYSEKDIAALQALPQVAFVVPQTRTLASTVQVTRPDRPPVSADVLPTATGDPLLERYTSVPPEDGAVITRELARSLPHVAVGQILPLTITRRVNGRPESVVYPMRLHGILPDAADWKAHIYVPSALLLDMEHYRDGFAVPKRGWPGAEPSGEQRRYAGFRMYVASLEAVIPVRDELKRRGIDAYTFAREVETIQGLKSALTLVTLLVGGVTLAGMAFSLASLATANVRRKALFFAQGHLMGLSRRELLLLPLLQMGFTALLAASTSLVLYGCAAIILEFTAAPWLESGEHACQLPGAHIAALYVGAFALACLCGLAACRHLLTFRPEEVLRRDA